MLRTILLLILVCLSPGLGQTAATDQRTGATDQRTGPKAYLPENVYEFAPIMEGQEVVHEFVVLNKGDEPLSILKIKSG